MMLRDHRIGDRLPLYDRAPNHHDQRESVHVDSDSIWNTPWGMLFSFGSELVHALNFGSVNT